MGGYYCYICNKPMRFTVYVCDAHKDDQKTKEVFHYVLGSTYGWPPRRSPDAPLMDLTRWGIHSDTDMLVDEGL